MQNKVQAFFSSHPDRADTARYALASVIGCILEVSREALRRYPGLELVFSGGVSSNSMLRSRAEGLPAVFSPPQFSTDNAMGIAVLTALQEGLYGA